MKSFITNCFVLLAVMAACTGFFPENVQASEFLCGESFSGTNPDGKYDFSTALFSGGLEKVARDWPRIFAFGVPVRKLPEGKEEEMKPAERSGRVVIVPPRYIITPFHIVDLLTYTTQRSSPFGIISVEEKADEVRHEMYGLKFTDSATLTPLKKIAVFPDIDAALFQVLDSDVLLTTSLSLGKSNELCLGHVIFILGSPGVLGVHVREGVISAFNLIPEEIAGQKIFAPLKMHLLMSISADIDRGDSGSPVVALRDGVPEVVAIASNVLGISSLMHGINMVIPIDLIVTRVREETGIDLKQLSDTYIH